ncbi:unnamed protein product [Closterium sp. Naga37s-1]|nr:unnamed protein product [Closterium sp. Naga37s-1]
MATHQFSAADPTSPVATVETSHETMTAQQSSAGTATPPDPSAIPSDPSANPAAPSATPPDPSASSPAASATPPDASATPSAPSATPPAPSATPPDPSATPSDPSATPPAPSASPRAPSASPPAPAAPPLAEAEGGGQGQDEGQSQGRGEAERGGEEGGGGKETQSGGGQGQGQSGGGEAAESWYKIKRVSFLGRQQVPIVMQNDNGPCPLLGIANVLLLRNAISLRPSATEISQSDLLSLVAHRLLDSNTGMEGRSAEYITNRQQNVADCMALLLLSLRLSRSFYLSQGRSAEYITNRQQNVADCMALLPRLATGIDVNVRFTGIHAFEFTPETAIFDLLDISLVHGWLVDSQDSATATAVGSLSYNSIVERLVARQAS